MITNITQNQLEQAIAATNAAHDYHLRVKDSRKLSANRLQFTIRSERSGIRGASITTRGHKSPAASWHAHGHLFDTILDTIPGAFIKTGFSGKTYTVQDRAWADFNKGSAYCPQRASELSVF